MNRCLIVFNSYCGRFESIDQDALVARFKKDYDIVDSFIINDTSGDWSAAGYNCVVVCGGDGSFNNALNHTFDENTKLIYFSFGTYNESAKTRLKENKHLEFIPMLEYAKANDQYFSYVFAAGSFTPLGYIVPPEKKKRLGILAYLFKVASQYKVYDIKAQISADNVNYDGNYTLIMFIDSMRCFGFNFNKLYSPSDGATHMLLIKSPGKNSFKNKIKIFWPLFKAFFIGLRKEVSNKKIVFKKVVNANLKFESSIPFNLDGEKHDFGGDVTVSVHRPKVEVFVGKSKNYTKKKTKKKR